MIATPCPTPSPEQILYTLHPLVERGRDALVPDLALGIREVVVRELGIIWPNIYQEIVVRRASNVIQCVEADGSVSELLPRGARPLFAVLRFHVVGAGQPYLAEIWPPHILTLTPAYAAELMRTWLAARGFARIGPPLPPPPPASPG
jgi:hypothetical protein